MVSKRVAMIDTAGDISATTFSGSGANLTSMTASQITDFSSAVSGLIGDANALVYKGVINCGANPNYPAADCGDLYVISVSGKIGGGSGKSVEAFDMVLCNTDSTASGDEAAVGIKWVVIQKNIVTLDDVADGVTSRIFSDTEKTKLSGIETAADVTDATNVAAAGALMSNGTGNVKATNLQNAGADLGAADVTVDLSNTNGSYVTNLTTDGTITAGTFSGAGTSLTGTASSLTAGNVTTNANLTGVVTSTGNATSIASGAIKANMLQSSAEDLGAANVTINLGNTNGSYVTNLTTDGTITGNSIVDNGHTVKYIDIGDWDMDASDSVAVAHGLTLGNIREVSFMIRNDDGTAQYQSNGYISSNQLGISSVDSTNINLSRTNGGDFDSATFDSTSYNRGWIKIVYVI